MRVSAIPWLQRDLQMHLHRWGNHMEAGKDGASANFDIRESQRLGKEATRERSEELKLKDTRVV